jgi:copper resistance protein C
MSFIIIASTFRSSGLDRFCGVMPPTSKLLRTTIRVTGLPARPGGFHMRVILEGMSHSTTPPRFFARAATAAVAAILLTVGGLLAAAPASAHDELVASDPAADTTLEAMPAQIALTFSGEIATDAGATELQVSDSSGASLADGDPLVQSNVVSQPLVADASGVITVLWKVVSSDGHPISGQYAFTVSGAPSPTATPTSTPTASASPSETPTQEPTAAPTETPVPADEGNPALPWIIGGLILLAAVGGAVVYLLTSRARRRNALAANREKALGGAPGADPSSSPESGSEPPAER